MAKTPYGGGGVASNNKGAYWDKSGGAARSNLMKAANKKMAPLAKSKPMSKMAVAKRKRSRISNAADKMFNRQSSQ